MAKKPTTRNRVVIGLVLSAVVGAVTGGTVTTLMFGFTHPLFVILGGLSGLTTSGANLIFRYEIEG